MTRSDWQATIATTAVAIALSIAGCNGNGSGVAPLPQTHQPPAAAQPHDSPAPTPTPIQLQIAGSIGTPTWPEGDTATGGQGQSIDGLNCLKQIGEPYHHHVQLSIFVNGQQLMVPFGVGMYQPGGGKSGYIYHQTCLYFIHTHDRTGIIHIESKTATPYTLGIFFKLWGEPLSATQIAQFTGPVSVYVNGQLDTVDLPQNVAMTPGEDITLVIGQTPSWIPAYILPPSLQP